MDNMIASYTNSIIKMCEDVQNRYENNLKIIEQSTGELNDLEHEAELGDIKSTDLCVSFFMDLRKTAQIRRKAKDENELMVDFYTLIKKDGLLNKIKQIQSNSCRIFNNQKTRVYHPRVRKDLSITGRTCPVNKPFEDMLGDFKRQNKIRYEGGKPRRV